VAKVILCLIVLILLAGSPAWGTESIINQQSLLSSLGSALAVSGPSGLATTNVGPILISLSQTGVMNDGLTVANQGINGILNQSGATNSGVNGGLTGTTGLTAGGQPFSSTQNDSPTGQDPQNASSGPTGTWVNTPGVLPLGSLSLPSSSLWIAPVQIPAF
jgi:hypothetical protein